MTLKVHPGEPQTVHARNERGQAICNAGLRGQPGRRCREYKALNPVNGRCKLHGGGSKAGMDHVQYKHGGYSRYAPSGYRDRIEAARGLRGLEEDIFLVTGRIFLVLEGMEADRETRDLWIEARGLFRKAMQLRGSPEGVEALTELGRVLERGASEHAKLSELWGLVERKRKLEETQTKREVLLDQYVPLREAKVAMDHFLLMVMDEVQDGATRQRIALRYAAAMGLPDPSLLPPALGDGAGPTTERAAPPALRARGPRGDASPGET